MMKIATPVNSNIIKYVCSGKSDNTDKIDNTDNIEDLKELESTFFLSSEHSFTSFTSFINILLYGILIILMKEAVIVCIERRLKASFMLEMFLQGLASDKCDYVNQDILIIKELTCFL